MNNPNEEKSNTTDNVDQSQEKKPDDSFGFVFSSAIKISDPDTKEVFVQIRGD